MLARLETQLNDFSLKERTNALLKLLQYARDNPGFLPEEGSSINMHCHSFFSFNSYGYSPSALVWLAKKIGLQAVGIVDFDNLDGVEEFLSACDRASVRGSAAMETRLFIHEINEYETNSPGEPGVSYATGVGFATQDVNEKGRSVLKGMNDRADQRNRGMTDRLNAYLHPVSIDYDNDVLPLTPSGNATERHMLVAYISSARQTYKDPAEFWADKLEKDLDTVHELMKNTAVFSDTVRRKLMKMGGIGYVKPGPESFPAPEEFYEMVISNNALPTYNYLNGTTIGEQRMTEVLELLVDKGIAAFNMIPNLAVPEPSPNPDNTSIRKERTRLLLRTADIAREFDLPLHIGTEMNSYGQRKVDDLETPELVPLRQRFIDGAYFIYGHVRLQRTLGMGYQSDWASSFMPSRAERNAFYQQAGYLIPPGLPGLQLLNKLKAAMSPKDVLARLEKDQ